MAHLDLSICMQVFTFPDYNDAELLAMLKGVMDKDSVRFKLEDERHAVIAACRLGRQRGTIGFGNARAVRNAYEAAVSRQSARVAMERGEGGDPDLLLITRTDLLGPKFLDVSSSAALKELAAMQGLKAVKKQVGCWQLVTLSYLTLSCLHFELPGPSAGSVCAATMHLALLAVDFDGRWQ